MELILKPKKLKYTAQDLIDSGISYDVAIEFMAHRKLMKCPCSKHALKAYCREASKAGMQLEEVFKVMMDNDWKGFKADWIKAAITIEPSFLDKHTDTSWAR